MWITKEIANQAFEVQVKELKYKTWPTLALVSLLIVFVFLAILIAPSYYRNSADVVSEVFVPGVALIYITRVLVAKIRKETNLDYIYYVALLLGSPFISKAIAVAYSTIR